MQSIKENIMSVLELIETRYERRGAIYGLSTPFRNFDALTNRLQDSDLVVIASTAGAGKTTFALNIVDHVAVFSKEALAIFSVGLKSDYLVQRLLCSRARTSFDKLHDGLFDEADFPNLTLASSKLAQSSIFMDDTGLLTLDELKRRAKKAKDQHDIKLLVVDNVHRLHSASRKAIYSREMDRTEVMGELKRIAEELSLPVLALARLTKRPNEKVDPSASLNDYQEAASIWDYADVVGLLERPALHEKNDDTKNAVVETAKLLILKSQNGSMGEVHLDFHKEYLRFEA